MVVYIVMNGENYEGGSVVSVHRTYEQAKRAALKVKALFEGGWKLEDEDAGLTCWWSNGCDWLRVFDAEVQE